MIQRYDGYYITSCGKVYSFFSNRFLSICKDKDGYSYVCMGKYGNHRIHRLVAETYLDNPNGFDTVDHIDFNKDNNSISNLRWLSHVENSGRKKKPKRVRCIETGEEFNTITEAARAYHKSRECLSNHLHGRQLTFCGKHWEVIT